MAKTRKEYELVLNELNKSTSEGEIIDYIRKIVKGFSVNFYKEDLTKNPFYKSILLEIKEDILEELYELRKAISDEIESIHNSINGGKDVDKLIPLKVECQLLLIELDYKIEDIKII